MKLLRNCAYSIGTTGRKIRSQLGFPANKKLIRFCGIQRSGNHALINWIIAQESQETCFVNGAFPGISPWDNSCWGISYPNFPYWPRQRDEIGAFVGKQLFIYSYENQKLSDIEADEKHLPKYIGKSQEQFVVLVLRDPYNTFASWLQRKTSVPTEVVTLWKSYAYEFIGKTNIISNPKVFISFNAWFLEPNYRQGLAKKLGLKFTDNGLSEVSHHGGGSSFDGQSLRGEARKMNVLTRFHSHLDNPEFYALFQSDPELKELSDMIFGPIDLSSDDSNAEVSLL